MLHLTKAQLKDMKHISLVDAIMEGRRRLKVAAKARRAEMKLYANKMREKEAAMTDAAATPPASTGTTSALDTGASSPPVTTEEQAADQPADAPPIVANP